jgi:hypothetical protein
MSAPNEVHLPASSDDQRSEAKLHGFKKMTKRVVLAMRFMSQTHADAENEPPIDRRSNVFADAPVYFSSMPLASFSDILF